MGSMRQEKVWIIPCEDLDHIAFKRLANLTAYDDELLDRLTTRWNQHQSNTVDEIAVLEEQLSQASAQIRRLDKLLTDPAATLSADAERRYLEMLRDAENDHHRLTQKLALQVAHSNPIT